MGRSKPETIAKRRQQRKEKGLCAQCPNIAVVDRTLCVVCLDKMKKRHIVYKKYKKENNICSKCPNPAINGTTMCQTHIDYLKDFRLSNLANGICSYCRKNKKIENKTYCISCRYKRAKKRNIKKEKGICVATGCKNLAELNKTYCKPCTEKNLAYRRELKEQVLIHYGYKCNCDCGCTVNHTNHLTIDHINNDGNVHRKKLGTKTRGGQAFYRWIIKNNFPTDLQILCWNCNCAKQHYGGCK